MPGVVVGTDTTGEVVTVVETAVTVVVVLVALLVVVR